MMTPADITSVFLTTVSAASSYSVKVIFSEAFLKLLRNVLGSMTNRPVARVCVLSSLPYSPQ